MSGDGDRKKSSSSTSKKEEAAKAKVLPAYMTSGETVQPFMPGFDNMIAQQLAAGGYGAAPDLLTYMQQFYSPMQVPGGDTPAPTTPTTTPTAPGIGGGRVGPGWGGRGAQRPSWGGR